MPTTFYLVLLVQFISSAADNAFLILSIARTMELAGAAWLIPVLKMGFTLFYVVLAPFVGPLADALRKGQVMLLSNILKVLAMLMLLGGAHPLVAIGIAGLGAAMYAPAKYGLITELLPARDLVVANGYFEGVTVTAVILGTALGGVLVSPMLTGSAATAAMDWLAGTHTKLVAGMVVLLLLNTVAAVLSVGVTDSGARYPACKPHPFKLLVRFHRENLMLWRDAKGGLSMAVTTLIWGVGATLQLIVLRWATESLRLPLAQAAYLQGVTALGVIVGALAASRWVALAQATRVLPLGIALGAMVPLLLLVHSVFWAATLLIVVGAVAGFFVVPMNAMLQHRGCSLLTAGRSIAVQGFNENAGMLLMLCLYAATIALEIPLAPMILGFGCLVVCPMVMLNAVAKHPLRPAESSA
ncbi:MAG: lysophospholipid transporter LplT [Burkholderiales bacterium]